MSSIVKSYSFPGGEIRGDMFFIQHNSNNFTVIDCFLKDGNEDNCRKDEIIEEIRTSSQGRICRFISTHPDNDHIQGLEYLDKSWEILNFYAVDNKKPAEENNPSLDKYLELLSDKNYPIDRGIKRKWLNDDDATNGSSGLKFHWPDLANKKVKETLTNVAQGGSPNNISCALSYSIENGATYMWMGDMETDMQQEFYDSYKDFIPKVDILFHPHHGRKSGRIPSELLKALQPKIIILGDAPSEHMDYGNSDMTITQNSSGDIVFVNEGDMIHIFTSKKISNKPSCLKFLLPVYLRNKDLDLFYCGTLEI